MTTTAPAPDKAVPERVRTAIADAVTADTGRQDLLIEYARALGPDPAMADLPDDELEQAVRVGAAEIAAATCRWLQLLAELVVRGVWADAGARTPASWLSWALGIAPSTAREHVRVALRLRECPMVRERMAAGSLSYSKTRAITRVATPETEEMLLRWADSAPAHVLERIITDARRQRAQSEPEVRDDLGLTRRWRQDGTYEVVLRVDAGVGLQVEQHIDRLLELDEMTDDDAEDGSPPALELVPDVEEAEGDNHVEAPSTPVPRTRRAADLVIGALGAAVAAGPADTSGADRHLVVLHTSAAELLGASDQVGEVEEQETAASAEAVEPSGRRMHLVRDGRGRVRSMSARTLWRLACSARLDIAVDDADGHPADNGRARRTPDARLRRLLIARDRTCRFPGCGATYYLHAHHVVHWEDGGPTDLDNLVLLCNHHHTVVHAGWDLRPAGRGRWTFHAPSSPNHHRSAPHPWAQRLPGASAEALQTAARAHANDLAPDARAKLLQPPHWQDHDYDHSMTVGVLVERLAAAA